MVKHRGGWMSRGDCMSEARRERWRMVVCNRGDC